MTDANLITELDIKQFRHLSDIKFKIGSRLTIIAGGNGTGKTSILGLIGHIFTYPKEYKSLFNQPYETQFSEVFKFSGDYDKGGDHVYELIFKNGGSKYAESRETTEGRRKRFRIDVGKRSSGEGKVNKPVIYLGLKRLIPLAQENEMKIKIGSEDKLSTEYKELFNKQYKGIFASEIDVTPKHTRSLNKEIYSPTSTKYDAFGISAGQDNIGQILLSLLSFRYLKDNVADYDGGLFIIDELDATLYPAAQKNLLDLLLAQAIELDLQIMFTTHSTDILNYIFSYKSSHFKHYTEFVYLDNTKGNVKVLQDGKILSNILADLNHEVALALKPERVNIYFEDNEGKIFFSNLIKGKGISDRVNLKRVSLGSGVYKNLLKARFPEFDNSLIILDGDYRKQLESKYHKKVCFLPGDVRPETYIRDFLESLDESDDFWSDAGKYSKRVFLQNSKSLEDDRKVMKRWFNNEKQYWGKGCSKLFTRWKNDNEKIVNAFLNDLDRKLGNILKK